MKMNHFFASVVVVPNAARAASAIFATAQSVRVLLLMGELDGVSFVQLVVLPATEPLQEILHGALSEVFDKVVPTVLRDIGDAKVGVLPDLAAASLWPTLFVALHLTN